MSKKKILQLAAESFLKRDYQDALNKYLAILREEPENKEAKLGAILCDLLSEDEEEAEALFDYYLTLKTEGEKEPEEKVMDIIDSLDRVDSDMNEIFSKESRYVQEGISYEDFKEIVRKRGDFKRTFEDIMFSTKVIITEKEDFFDFLDNLVQSGYKEIAYSYLEDASKLYPADERLQQFVDKLRSNEL